MTPEDNSFTPDDFRRATELLEAIQSNRLLLAKLPQDERRALLMAAGRVSRPERLELMKVSKRHRRIKKRKEIQADRAVRDQTGIRGARRSSVFLPPPATSPDERAPRGKLNFPRSCYVCKVEYDQIHFYYDTMCLPCGDFNYGKRFQTASLEGRYAVITGARVKIGYQAALMMLRAGAHVVVTTRFPRDAASRFATEGDFDTWRDRLRVHGLDLRHAPSVELFCRFLCDSLPRLDILINNAAQTVRRPIGWYSHLLEKEELPLASLPSGVQAVLGSHEELKTAFSSAKRLPPMPATGDSRWIAEWHSRPSEAAIGIRESSLLSQRPWTNEDMTAGQEVFPVGKLDADLQQVDLRSINTWRLPLAQVPTPEMIEVQLVNSVAPFILCGKLKPLMLRVTSRDKHVINVSAMEGKFARHTKTDKHPHTNMAKAALNMMTLTSAPDYLKDGIHMNAVDTGWVTDEDPLHLSQRKIAEHDFQPPLDIVDGAARVCDPFFSGLLTGEHVWGKFLKDYTPTEW